MKYFVFTLLGIGFFIFSCSNETVNTKNISPAYSSAVEQDPFILSSGETIVITSSDFGCFHHEHLRALIKNNNNQYEVKFEILQDSMSGICGTGFTVTSTIDEIWDNQQYESFMDNMKTDTSKQTTSMVHYDVRKKTDTYTFKNTTGKGSALRKFAIKSS